jgi:hypothetical protein
MKTVKIFKKRNLGKEINYFFLILLQAHPSQVQEIFENSINQQDEIPFGHFISYTIFLKISS